ncbi:uncharacterized protein LOC101855758 [Aplysia californica]|uniref:Uncharacterized protein LOC101855758 n=1 Tax=Aplysia californica TaxID=6500 RepID=A0ABM0JA61_APLCA|nr:uncharacterized protein LOC101855758 [Aplysia californica]
MFPVSLLNNSIPLSDQASLEPSGQMYPAPPHSHNMFPTDTLSHPDRLNEWTTNYAISQVLMTMGDPNTCPPYPVSNCTPYNGHAQMEDFSPLNLNFPYKEQTEQQPQLDRRGQVLFPLGEGEKEVTEIQPPHVDRQHASQTSGSRQIDVPASQSKKRERKRTASQAYAERKRCSNTNQCYINSKGTEVLPRVFDSEFDCACSKECMKKVSVEDRENLFSKYWNCGSFEARSAIINYCVSEENVARHYSKSETKRRTKTRRYVISGVEVCQKAFLRTLQINESRVATCLRKVTDPTASVGDQRGKRGKHRLALEERYQAVVEHIHLLSKEPRQGHKRKNLPRLFDSDLECCSRKCLERVSYDERKNLFIKYWECPSFEARSAVIVYCVKEEEVRRHYSKCGSRRRSKTRRYRIAETDVCQKAFLKTLQINESRVATCLRKVKDPSASVSDQRGSRLTQTDHRDSLSGQDKLSQARYTSIFQHINSMSSQADEKSCTDPQALSVQVSNTCQMRGTTENNNQLLHRTGWMGRAGQ